MENSEDIIIRRYTDADIDGMTAVWNEVVWDGIAFPQREQLDAESGREFFAAQTYCGVAEYKGEIKGMYILHPNNVGRCGHICNASYAVDSKFRGHGAGKKLVLDCLEQARAHGFCIMQFNAVVASNETAIKLYESLGFKRIGTVPKGFQLDGGEFSDIILFYYELK